MEQGKKGEQQGYANEDQHKSKVWIEQGTEFSANGWTK